MQCPNLDLSFSFLNNSITAPIVSPPRFFCLGRPLVLPHTSSATPSKQFLNSFLSSSTFSSFQFLLFSVFCTSFSYSLSVLRLLQSPCLAFAYKNSLLSILFRLWGELAHHQLVLWYAWLTFYHLYIIHQILISMSYQNVVHHSKLLSPDSYVTFFAISFSKHVFITIKLCASANCSSISPSSFLFPNFFAPCTSPNPCKSSPI